MPRKAKPKSSRAARINLFGKVASQVGAINQRRDVQKRFDEEQDRLRDAQREGIKLQFQKASTAGVKAQADLERAKAELAESKRRGTKDAASIAAEERRVAALEGRLSLDKDKFAFDKTRPSRGPAPSVFQEKQARLRNALTPNIDDSPIAAQIMQVTKDLADSGIAINGRSGLPELLARIKSVFGDEDSDMDDFDAGLIANYILDQADELPMIISPAEKAEAKSAIGGMLESLSTPEASASNGDGVPSIPRLDRAQNVPTALAPGEAPNIAGDVGQFVSQNLLPIPNPVNDIRNILDARLRGK